MKTNNNGLHAWEANAEFWDNYMGDESNFFHRDLVRPVTEKFLNIQAHDYVLDIACGNGNFSARMAEKGAQVVAFDYSPKMIELAKQRRKKFLQNINFQVCDASNYEALMHLKSKRPFTKAVANMALMDIMDIAPLFQAVHDMLDAKGIFVFSMHHPCFTFPHDDYFTQSTYEDIAVEGQPVLQNYHHRSLTDMFTLTQQVGFTVTGFQEIPFAGENVPIIMIVRLEK